MNQQRLIAICSYLSPVHDLVLALSRSQTCLLVQAYLNSALIIWWTQKHAMTSWDKKSNMGEWIRMRVDHVNAVACKVRTTHQTTAVFKFLYEHQGQKPKRKAAKATK